MKIRLEQKVFYSYLDDIISENDNDSDTDAMYRKVVQTFLLYGEIEVDEVEHRMELYFKPGTILPIREEDKHTVTSFYGIDLDIGLDDIRMSIL